MSATRGRPRDDAAGPALLAAARRLVIARGYAAVSVAAIADAAGTGRQTLYRRWPGKAELVLDAFTRHAVDLVDAEPETGTGPDAVRRFLARTFRALDETAEGLRGLMGHAQRDPAFRVALRERFVRPRRAALRALLVRGVAEGTLPADLDPDAAVYALYGGLWYRLLLDEPLDDAYAAALVRQVVGA